MEEKDKSHKDPEKMSITELADYIDNNYHKPLRARLARLEELIEKVHTVHKARMDESLSFLKMVFISFKEELMEHLVKEETVLFPYIRQLEDFSLGKSPRPVPPEGTIKTVISYMEMYEHTNALKSLQEIRELTHDYSLPDFKCLIFPLLYEGLEKLEKDLYEHIHLENHVLFPGTIKLEEKFLL